MFSHVEIRGLPSGPRFAAQSGSASSFIVVAVPLDGIHELIVHSRLTPPTWTCQDDRLRLAKGAGPRPKQLARDYHRIEHLDSALGQ
ncbi:hypothetical protein [Streptomyces sp. NPDC095613]|uniref:hypothetical protein n=1 Tax=Streptomyces sp. NPDC095613 TaxID=3155540 RepID=UPI0033292AC7